MKLKAYRKKYDISQQQMAKRLRCTQGWLSRIELGLVKPNAEMAVRIEKATDSEVPRWEYRADLWPRPRPMSHKEKRTQPPSNPR